ncbi:MAG TPA: hypothetical protein VK250_03770 [Nitrososphaeraceae archaeon]|nr:hypothetical protein [Nitrososphaeraceae archaeon]
MPEYHPQLLFLPNIRVPAKKSMDPVNNKLKNRPFEPTFITYSAGFPVIKK